MLGLSAGAADATVRFASLTQPVGGVLWPAWGSLLHQRLGRLGSYLMVPRLGVLWRGHLVSGCKEEGNGSTDRKRKGLQGWPESQPSGDPERQTWLTWVAGEASSMQLALLTAAKTLSLGSKVFPLLPGRRAEGKSESDQFCFWSSGGPERERVDGLHLLCKHG